MLSIFRLLLTRGRARRENIPTFLEIIYIFEVSDDFALNKITSSFMNCRREYPGESMLKKCN